MTSSPSFFAPATSLCVAVGARRRLGRRRWRLGAAPRNESQRGGKECEAPQSRSFFMACPLRKSSDQSFSHFSRLVEHDHRVDHLDRETCSGSCRPWCSPGTRLRSLIRCWPSEREHEVGEEQRRVRVLGALRHARRRSAGRRSA